MVTTKTKKKAVQPKKGVKWMGRMPTPCPKCKAFDTRVYCTRDAVHYLYCAVCNWRFKAVDSDLEVELAEKRAAAAMRDAQEGAKHAEIVLTRARQRAREVVWAYQTARAEYHEAKKRLEALRPQDEVVPE